jgi:hypothetical protein
MLGGINIPKQPPEQITPDANFLSYPALTIAGQANKPISVTTAPIIPVAVEKRAQVIRAATAIDAGNL